LLRGLVTAWKVFCYSVGTLVAGVLLVQLWFFGHILYWNWYEPTSTAFMERQAVQVQQQWVPYARISVHLKRAVVVAEDARFLDHEGFDWQSIQLAMAKNEERGKLVAGASTISQQLAKNLFLSGERSWIRKAEEAAITWMLEHTLSKRRILELYLNVAEWGDGGVFGAEAAARHHFGRTSVGALPGPGSVGSRRFCPARGATSAAVLRLTSPKEWSRSSGGWETRRSPDTLRACRKRQRAWRSKSCRRTCA